MDSSILKFVGQVAGIGGIALGVLFLIFRDIIRRNIFPQLNRKDAYKIIRLIILLTFTIAVLGLAAWFFASTKTNPITNNFDFDVSSAQNNSVTKVNITKNYDSIQTDELVEKNKNSHTSLTDWNDAGLGTALRSFKAERLRN